ncbi:MAG TPA: VWA domain-containing protein [Verrucomicrobiota bacterium]|nr:VWA domain-containing protein [Verrucomicrobiota bacterium]HNT14195.1 VWA domain-containing protein [Verrucomicrobiota bacterium]
MTFGHPYLLLLLLLLPLAAWLKGRRGRPAAFIYSSVQLLRGMQGLTKSRAGRLLLMLRWLALALLLLALAQPRLTQFDTTRVTASGIDMVVAFDLSGSMAAEDFELRGQRVNRVEMARAVLEKFIARRPNDRIGLVAFGTQAFLASPITLDHDFLLRNLERLDLNTIEGSQTAIGAALTTALNQLRDLKSKSKIIILMTDGQNNAGKIPPLTAAEAARALGVKVYTIGVGTQGQAPMPTTDFFGRRVYQMVPVDIDEATLRQIAELTDGTYYRADNAAKFAAIYAEIDKLEKTEADVKKFARHTELFPWFIVAGLVALGAELALGQTVLRRLP